MLLFDPFLQQVIVYPDRLVPSDKAALITRAHRYQARSDEGLPLPSIVDMSMKVSTGAFFEMKKRLLMFVKGCHLFWHF